MVNKLRKQGFTLVELMVTLMILSIVSAIAVPGLSGYIHDSQFRRNNSYAKTLYYAAEAALTDMRTSGQWDDFSLEIQNHGQKNDDASAGGNQIYAIRLNSGETVQEGKLVRRLLEDTTYDQSLLSGVIALEIDVSAGKVYGVFYGTHCAGLTYDTARDAGYYNMNDRDYDLRRRERVGYYGAGEVTPDVGLEMSRLKITSIHLLNSEALTLNWSSNSRYGNKDLRFEIRIYDNANGKELLFTELDSSRLDLDGGSVSLEVTIGENRQYYTFPLSYERERFSLTLDAMMTADLMDALSTAEQERGGSTSITRFSGLEKPLDIYATIKAYPTYPQDIQDTREYQESTPTKSNVANTLFADGSGEGDYRITAFRHLSNIRYVADAGNFTITKVMLDWALADAPIYTAGLARVSGEDKSFPAVDRLRQGQTLSGGKANTTLRNLKLDEASIPGGEAPGRSSGAGFLGLFRENQGTIQDLHLDRLDLSCRSSAVRGVGGFCGYSGSTGLLKNLSASGTVAVYFEGILNETAADAHYGAGAVAGILEKGVAEDLSASGQVTVRLPGSVLNSAQLGGVGGIIGCADLSGAASRLKDCSNRAAVNGNAYVGGVVGSCSTGTTPADTGSDADLLNCSNTGLVLYEKQGDTQPAAGAEGCYIGGIAGHGEKIYISGCTSSSGRALGFAYTAENKDLLRGRFVGGILGFGQDSLLYNCSTGARSYVLGGDYVGGIVGGLDGGAYKDVLQSASVTRNSSYVIGNNYVGGICGQNTGSSIIKDCVNNGVAVGYGEYVGGICGSNETSGQNIPVIQDCASYISDTSGSIYELILDWKAEASFVGGLVGYNSGKITFDGADITAMNHDVSSIVVGRDYVGGVVGFNDAGAQIDAEYGLISGRIYATGDCVGGLVGLNASTQLLEQEKELKVLPILVQGRNCVGGAIGANLVNLDKDVTLSNIWVDSSLGTVTGEAFCGGLMGYTATHSQASGTLRSSARSYLPRLNGTTCVPELPGAQETEYALTITPGDFVQDDVLNNMEVRAYAYFGGILGFAHGDSKVILLDCVNEGDITLSTEPLLDGASGLDQGVSVKDYLSGYPFAEELDGLRAQMAGGVVGVNGKNHVIDNCRNEGTMSGVSAMGGIVGLNQGLVANCQLTSSLGSSGKDYIGGIVGINAGTGTELTYNKERYTQGTVLDCATGAGRTVIGDENVGGIAGYNSASGAVRGCVNRANVSGGSAVGGFAGKNAGTISLVNGNENTPRTISASGEGAGGVVGINTGTLELQGTGEVVAADGKLTVRARIKAGGVVGINRGTIQGRANGRLVSEALLVRATQGYAGGVVGCQEGQGVTLSYAENRSAQVSADAGAAGGIVSVNGAGNTVTGCVNRGNVVSNDGYAGGVVSENHGTISSCTVDSCTIITKGEDASGVITAVNHPGGIVTACAISGNPGVQGTAHILGAIVGLNRGTVSDTTLSMQPGYSGITAGELILGGAVGHNDGGTIQNVTVQNLAANVDRYRYFGGVVGWNEGTVSASHFSGTITETAGAPGNCYGGIAGLNEDRISGCSVSGLAITAQGVYTATSTSTTEQKERLSTHIGGIAGKNEASAVITGCTIDSANKSTITVQNGMVGGIAGFNKGTITNSGDSTTVNAIAGADTVTALLGSLAAFDPDTDFVRWANPAQVENLVYDSTNTRVSSGRSMQIIISANGNLGGITGYNAPTGRMSHCATGFWLLNNKSEALGVGVGGIVGMNESEQDLSFLVNRAFVGRQLQNGTSDRFAGGIIGNQNNTTSSGWTLRQCVNYGGIYCYKAHYSGGIIGQWTGTGGNVTECYNYAALHTTHQAGWVGAAGGIVAQLYHPNSGEDFNIISCQNRGSIYGQSRNDTSWCANDSAGILGNITAYTSGSGQRLNINVIDCVNGPGVTITSASMASGIVGFVSTVGGSNIVASTQNIVLNIDRCRNYAKTFTSGGSSFKGGIFGDRYGSGAGVNTYITNCFSVYADNNFPVVSLNTGSSASLVAGNVGNNYYFGDGSMSQSGTVRGAAVTNLTQYIGTDGGATEFAAAGTRMIHLVKNSNGGYLFVQKGLDSPHAGNNASGGASKSVTRYNNFTQNSTYIGNDGLTLYSRGTRDSYWSPIFSGRVIFALPSGYNPSSYTLNAIKSAGSNFDTYVRTAYEKLERMVGNRADVPGSVTTTESQGAYTITVTDTHRPLYYRVRLTQNDGETYRYLFPKGMANDEGKYVAEGVFYLEGSDAAVEIQAVSMFGEASDWVSGNKASDPMPTPELEGRLVKSGTAYEYRFRVKNLEDYAQIPGWRITATTLDGQTMTFSADAAAAALRGRGNIQELTIVALAPADTNYANSEPVSMPVSIPENGRPAENAKPASFAAVVLGNTLDTLEITAKMSWGTGRLDTPPVYRVELLGTLDDREVVLASSDVLAAAGRTISTTLRNLPEAITEAENLRLRAWYADTGLGAILTYEEVADQRDANVIIRNADGSHSYLSSTVLENSTDFAGYILETGELGIRFLERPALMETSGYLDQVMEDNKLSYRFSWDGDVAGTARYAVELVGLQDTVNSGGDPTVKEVLILTDSAYTDSTARSFTINADDWQYDRVRLTVTRLGSDENDEIGLSSSREYLVSRRLAAPGQPLVSNADPNELVYTVAWDYPAENCGGYVLYVTGGKKDETIQITGSTATVLSIDLNENAGRTVDICLQAKASGDAWADSPLGTSYSLSVPNRLPIPDKVQWFFNWQYRIDAPMDAADFRTGGMEPRIDIREKDTGKKYDLPGGSAFLLKADFVEWDETAQEYVSVDTFYAEQAMTTGDDINFTHALESLDIHDAGRWVQFSLRATYGKGMVSSEWAKSEPFQLPYVRLEKPAAESRETTRTATVYLNSTPDLNTYEISEEWDLTLRTLEWSSVECADVYPVTITYADGSALELRIYQENGGVRVEKLVDGTWVTQAAENSAVTLASTGELMGQYTGNDILPYFTYAMDTQLTWAISGEGCTFTLLLPNVSTALTYTGELLDVGENQAASVTVWADVRENLAEGRQSPSYVRSEGQTHDYKD